MDAMKAKALIEDYMAARPDEVAFLRTEFNGLGDKSRSAIDRAIIALIREGKLVRGGWGIVVRAEYNDLGDRLGIPYAPVTGVSEWGFEALRKLGVKDPDLWPQYYKALEEYNTGRSTQVPAGARVSVGDARISRNIGFNKNRLEFWRG